MAEVVLGREVGEPLNHNRKDPLHGLQVPKFSRGFLERQDLKVLYRVFLVVMGRDLTLEGAKPGFKSQAQAHLAEVTFSLNLSFRTCEAEARSHLYNLSEFKECIQEQECCEI